MNGRDLLYAIAGTDKTYLAESERFDAIGTMIKNDRNKQRLRLMQLGGVLAAFIAVVAVVKKTPASPEPRDTEKAERPAPIADDTETDVPFASLPPAAQPTETAAWEQDDRAGSETAYPFENGTKAAEQNTQAPPPTEAPTEAPTRTQPAEPPTEKPDETPTGQPSDPGGPGTPNAVLTQVSVDFAAAREAFGHPIVPCESEGFIGYTAGIVSSNGDTGADGAFCFSVTYAFTDGRIVLQDQDRLMGSTASDYGERYEYRGRTFYVWTYNGNGVYEDRVHVGYYPTWENGIAYVAAFGADADVYAIMDRIISVEI